MYRYGRHTIYNPVYHPVIYLAFFCQRILYFVCQSNVIIPMSAIPLLYPHFGSGSDHVIYHKSASTHANHYFILVSDPDVFKRTGIRIATFSYEKTDVQYEKAIVRYGNTSPKIRLPNRSFEAAVKDAIQQNEGVYKTATPETAWLKKMHLRLEVFAGRILHHNKNRKLRSS